MTQRQQKAREFFDAKADEQYKNEYDDLSQFKYFNAGRVPYVLRNAIAEIMIQFSDMEKREKAA